MRHNQMASSACTPDQRCPLDWPTYWFAALERAVHSGDWQAAAEAQRQLERLGVTVIYRPLEREAAAV